MKAMLLAAGLGTRLKPLTDRTPKPLLPLAGRPMIHYPLAFLRRSGVTEVVINTHLHPEKFSAALGDGSALGLKITFTHEPVLLDTGGGIKNAEHFFRGETFVALNADTLIEVDLKPVLAAHRERKPLATLVLIKTANAAEFSAVEVDAAGRIRRLRGQPAEAPAGALSPYTFTGLQVIEPEVLDALPSGKPACLIRDAYLPLLGQGRELRAFFMDGYWKSLDTPARMREAEEDIRAGKFSLIP